MIQMMKRKIRILILQVSSSHMEKHSRFLKNHYGYFLIQTVSDLKLFK